MTITEALPWLNLLLFPILGYVLKIEGRITRLEAIQETEERILKQLNKGVVP